MIQVSISEIKNRLSYYLRLVRGGEQVEILDRKTPMARLIHVSRSEAQANETPWIKEVELLGIVKAPQKRGFPPGLIAEDKVVSTRRETEASVLEALLEERNAGR
jgi:antitoxin (DNA-binding transcriptional repressor) of toxin-antitoxin stability system